MKKLDEAVKAIMRRRELGPYAPKGITGYSNYAVYQVALAVAGELLRDGAFSSDGGTPCGTAEALHPSAINCHANAAGGESTGRTVAPSTPSAAEPVAWCLRAPSGNLHYPSLSERAVEWDLETRTNREGWTIVPLVLAADAARGEK